MRLSRTFFCDLRLISSLRSVLLGGCTMSEEERLLDAFDRFWVMLVSGNTAGKLQPARSSNALVKHCGSCIYIASQSQFSSAGSRHSSIPEDCIMSLTGDFKSCTMSMLTSLTVLCNGKLPCANKIADRKSGANGIASCKSTRLRIKGRFGQTRAKRRAQSNMKPVRSL